MSLTTDPHNGCLHEIGPDGMQRCYLILPDGQRKDLVRPLRRTYIHAGMRPRYSLRELTDEEKERHAGLGYVAFETYPKGISTGSVIGRFWTERDLNSGCGSITTMAREIAETYAVNPAFYGATFCVKCGSHFRVGQRGEFVWEDGTRVGT